MKSSTSLVAATLCAVALHSSVARAQHVGDTRVRYSAWVSGTWNGPVSNAPSPSRHRALVMAGVERSFQLVAGDGGVLSYAPALLPGVLTSDNRRTTVIDCGTARDVICTGSAAYSTFGIGAIPLAIRYDSPFLGRIAVDGEVDGGGIKFIRPVPAPSGTTFNFTARAGADIKFRATAHGSIFAGYRHVHISNGGTGQANPGIDMPALMFGWEWR